MKITLMKPPLKRVLKQYLQLRRGEAPRGSFAEAGDKNDVGGTRRDSRGHLEDTLIDVEALLTLACRLYTLLRT